MEIVLSRLPRNAEEFNAMPELDFASPFHIAALFIVALCIYPQNSSECFRIIDILRGPQKLSPMERQFIHNRMIGKSLYIGKSYLNGATPENDYAPTLPYAVGVESNWDTYAVNGYAKLYIRTGGADKPRPIELRKKGEDWYLWEYTELFADIYKPTSTDPWL